MPKKRRNKKTQGNKLELDDFLGDFKPKNVLVLPDKPSGEEGGDFYGRRNNRNDRSGFSRNGEEREPSRAEESDKWRRVDRGGQNAQSGFRPREGFGDTRNNSSFSSGFRRSNNQFGNLDDSRDTRPEHLRRRAQGKAGPSSALPKANVRATPLSNAKEQEEKNARLAKKAAKEKAEREAKRVVEYDDNLGDVTGNIKDRTTKLELCIMDVREVKDAAELAEGLRRINVNDFDREDVVSVLHKSLTSKHVSPSEMVATLLAHAKADASALLAESLQVLVGKRGEVYVRELVKEDNAEVVKALIGSQSGDKADAFLTDHDLLFLKPVGGELTSQVQKLCDQHAEADKILAVITAGVPEGTPVDFLVNMVAERCLNQVFMDAKAPAVDVFETFAPLIKRVVLKSVAAEMEFVFALQVAWATQGKQDTKTIKNVVVALYNTEAISWQGFDQWRQNVADKRKGKVPMLLRVANFIDENAPVEEVDEEDDEEEGEEVVDEFLVNSNTLA